MVDPRSSPPYEHGRLGFVERTVAILQSLTLSNILIFGILVVLAIPSWTAYQLLSDSDLRREVLSWVQEIDAKVPCQVIIYSFTGQGQKTAVASTVDWSGQYEIIVATRVSGAMSQKEIADACATMKVLGVKYRDVTQPEGKK